MFAQLIYFLICSALILDIHIPIETFIFSIVLVPLISYIEGPIYMYVVKSFTPICVTKIIILTFCNVKSFFWR